MHVRTLFAVLLLAALMPWNAEAGRRSRRSSEWKELDGNVKYRAKLRSIAEPFCDIHILNDTKKPIAFVEFEFSYQDPRNHHFVRQRRTFKSTLAPKTFFYDEDWRADTTDCDSVTVQVNTVRFAR